MSYLRDDKSPEGVKAQEKRGLQTDSQRRREGKSKCTFSPGVRSRPAKGNAHDNFLFSELYPIYFIIEGIWIHELN